LLISIKNLTLVIFGDFSDCVFEKGLEIRPTLLHSIT